MKPIITILALSSMAALAADPWKTKAAGEWTDKEVQRVLTDSPWAKKATTEMGFGAMGGGMGGPGGGGMGGRGGGMGGPGGGGMGGPGGGGMGGPGGGADGPGEMQAPRIVVRWESAEPVQQALIRAEHPAAGKLAEWARDYFVISTSGMGPMRGGRGRGGSEGLPQPDPTRMEEMQKRMLAATSLKLKSKETINPARIETVEAEGGMLTVFLFPRNSAISGEEVTFETALGPLAVKTKFDVREMQYQGKPAM